MVDLESGLGLGTKIALASTLAKTQHTISEIGSNPLETNEAGETVVKGEGDDFFITNVHQYFIQAVAVFGGATALITMVLLEGQLIDIASLGTMLLAPLVFWQKMQLNKLGGMRKQQNELRHSVNRFTVENNKLQEANTQLEKEVDGSVIPIFRRFYVLVYVFQNFFSHMLFYIFSPYRLHNNNHMS